MDRVAGAMVRLRSVGNSLRILTVLLATRYVCRRGAPFLGVPRWPLDEIDRRTMRGLLVAHVAASRLQPAQGWRWTIVVAAIALALKLTFAWTSPGFYRGDDVEVQEMTIGALTHMRGLADLERAQPGLSDERVYPPQRLARAAGVTSTQTTVFVGRASVALLSTLAILLLWRTGRLLFPGEAGFALLAVVLFASNKLHISFGSSELPVGRSRRSSPPSPRRCAAGRWRAPARGERSSVSAAALRFGEAGFVAAARNSSRWSAAGHTRPPAPWRAFWSPALPWAWRIRAPYWGARSPA